ncbi:hypothetical protein GXP67_32650 [Rhodocytophaga rosea]|uniref:Uncharacterized protein n=1 Tax=Rhodocytophaga rosea TaxID=2704465 RepID=A0A6C0GSS4_9BACT|nr:DUF6580 family putative transport protein [Rhodocytophaga rosea]QHT71066.1 hypothetical protein GXP67_32650 [Rhodocytophaga rosea]
MNKIQPRTIVLGLFIILAALYRLLLADNAQLPFSNFTPIGAMALFGGCYFYNKGKAFAFPLLSLWIGDIFLNRYWYFDEWVIFYDGFAWVYASFLGMVLIGRFIKKVSVISVVLSAVSAALLHWLVSDLGVLLSGGTDVTTGLPYTRDLEGLLKCYYLAIPYMQNMLVGNLVYCALFFGVFELLQKRYPALKLQVVS